MRARKLWILLVAALPLLGAAQPDERVVKPEIRVGDSWTYRSSNLLAPGTDEQQTRVSFVSDKAILVVSTLKSSGKEFDSSWTLEWNAVTSHSGLIFRPHSGLFRFPLRVGDKYGASYDLLQPKVNTILNTASHEVTAVAWETIEVPAGKFRVIRLEQEARIEAADGSNAYQVKGTYWYSPDVRRWVKFQLTAPKVTFSEELLTYKLNEN